MVHDVGTTTTAATVSSGTTGVITDANTLGVGLFVESGWHNALVGDPEWNQRANVSPTDDMELLVQDRSEEHTPALQSLMRISYAVLSLQTQNKIQKHSPN